MLLFIAFACNYKHLFTKSYNKPLHDKKKKKLFIPIKLLLPLL